LLQSVACFDQHHFDAVQKFRIDPCRAQGIGHQRTAAGAEFDQAGTRGAALIAPRLHAP
jgi:hypothetical protein